MCRKLTQEEFIRRAIEIHGLGRYDYSESYYIDIKTKIKIKCNVCFNTFEQIPDVHLHLKCGCSYCGGTKRLTLEQFIEKADLIHNQNEILYTYEKVVYINNSISIKIFCIHCNKYFEQKPVDHLVGKGCKYCKGYRSSKKQRKSLSDLIQQFKLIHKDKYDYSNICYVNNITKINIFCNTCKKFFSQTPGSHLNGNGCPYCSGRHKTTENIIKEFQKVHRLLRYDYSKINFIDSYTPLEIMCNICGKTFFQLYNNHLKGQGCPDCKKSKGEKKIKVWLENNKIKYKTYYKFNNCINFKTNYHLKFDFYLPDSNLCIEYDGIQHYEKVNFFGGDLKFKENQYRDKIKTDYCKDNNIRLLRIPYWDFDNIETILEKEIIF
jgi:hypothetical protein